MPDRWWPAGALLSLLDPFLNAFRRRSPQVLQPGNGTHGLKGEIRNRLASASTALNFLPMDIITGHLGWIEVICGPMFSGKSEELIRRLRRALIARKRVQVFKPVLRRSLLARRNRLPRRPSHARSQVRRRAGILERIEMRTQVVGMDEANFFGTGLIDVAGRLADSGKQVIIAGLDTDYMGRPFPPIPDLLALAESITKTLAICMRCGNPAKHTQRLVESNELIMVGAARFLRSALPPVFRTGHPAPGTPGLRPPCPHSPDRQRAGTLNSGTCGLCPHLIVIVRCKVS